MKDDPDKADRTHSVERTIVEMAMSAMETAVEAGNGVPEAKALARAAATILASVVVGGVLTRVERTTCWAGRSSAGERPWSDSRQRT